MPIFPEERCANCGGPHGGPQQAVVAFSAVSNQVVVVAATPHIICDMQTASIDAGDVFKHDGDPGIFMWSGRIVYTTTPSSPNGPEEHDVEYDGSFRPLTAEESEAVRTGKDPWGP